MNTSARRHPIVCLLALAAGLVLSGCRTGDGPVQAPGSASIVARRLAELEARPHVYPPQTIAGDPAVFQFALLDTKGVQPNIFNSKIAGVNDTDPFGTAGPDSIGLVRLVVLARPGLSSDPADPRTPIGVYLDIAGLQPAMAESGVYELFALYNTMVPPSAAPRADGQAQYGTITPDDAKALSQMGAGNNVPGNIFTLDGNAPRFYSPDDRWPGKGTNVITFPVNAGTFNSLSSGDAHAYFEFKPATNMVFPHHEFPYTGGVPPFYPPSGAYEAGVLGQINSTVPSAGPKGKPNDPRLYGDNPENPRDPDRAAADRSQWETRLRSIPSGLTEEIHRDIFLRRTSFHPEVSSLPERLYLSIAKEIALVDKNGDGVLSFDEVDIDGTSDGLPNHRLYFPLSRFSRFTVQKELSDGLIAPRFANSTRAVVFSGFIREE